MLGKIKNENLINCQGKKENEISPGQFRRFERSTYSFRYTVVTTFPVT